MKWRNCLNLACNKALKVAKPQGYSEVGSGSAAVRWGQTFGPFAMKKSKFISFLKGF